MSVQVLVKDLGTGYYMCKLKKKRGEPGTVVVKVLRYRNIVKVLMP